MRHPPRLTVSTFACALVLILSACGSQTTPPTGPPGPSAPAAADTGSGVTPTLRTVAFSYTDDSTAEVNVTAGITIESLFEDASFTAPTGTLHVPADIRVPFPVFLKDPAGNIRALSEIAPGSTQVNFSALETARAMVQETLLVTASDRSIRALVQRALSAGTYDDTLRNVTAAVLGGQGPLDTDANLLTAYDVAVLALRDAASHRVRPQAILKNARDEGGLDLLGQVNLDVTEEKADDGIETKLITLLNKGPVTYGVNITDDTRKPGEDVVSHMNLVASSGPTDIAVIDAFYGTLLNNGHVDLYGSEYTQVRCHPLTVTYAASELHSSPATDTHPADLSPLLYNMFSVASVVSDFIDLPSVPPTQVKAAALVKFSTAVTAVIARVTSNSALSGNTADAQPGEKLAFIAGLLRDLEAPTYDLARQFFPKEEQARTFEEYLKTKAGWENSSDKAFEAWKHAKTDAQLSAVLLLTVVVDAAKVESIAIEITRELHDKLFRTSRILFNPCEPVIKVDPVTPLYGKIGDTLNGSVTVANTRPNSTLIFTTSTSGALNFQTTTPTLITNDEFTSQKAVPFTAPCTTAGTRTETINVRSNDRTTPVVGVLVTVTCSAGALNVPSSVSISAPVGRTAEASFNIRNTGVGTLNYTITGQGFDGITPSSGTVSANSKDGVPVTLLYTCRTAGTNVLTLRITGDPSGVTLTVPVNIECLFAYPYPQQDAYLKVKVVTQGGGGGYIDDTHTTVYCTAFATYDATFTIDASVDNTEAHFFPPGTRFNTRTFTPLTIDFRINEPTPGQCADRIRVMIDTWVQERQTQTLTMYQARLIPALNATDLGGVSSSADLTTTYSVRLTPTK